jgi:type IV pilus modification protein PilV
MRKSHPEKGFSLIEVLTAMVILSVGMLGTAALISGIIRGNQTSRNVTTATTLAQDKMEQIVKAGYSGISSSTATETEDYNSITNYDNFRRVTDITVCPDDGVGTDCNGWPKMKIVAVSVSWQTGTNPVTLTTVIAR